jgi:CubicO group peptidase (beta-lactamase class C family)
VSYATRNHTGTAGNGAWDFFRESRDLPDFPAYFSLLGGYVRGDGLYLTALSQTASCSAFGAVGGGSTFWMVDPERDLTFVFLGSGFLFGLDHMRRLEQLADMAIAAVEGLTLERNHPCRMEDETFRLSALSFCSIRW